MAMCYFDCYHSYDKSFWLSALIGPDAARRVMCRTQITDSAQIKPDSFCLRWCKRDEWCLFFVFLFGDWHQWIPLEVVADKYTTTNVGFSWWNYFPSFVNDYRSVLFFLIEKHWQLSACMFHANASWMLMLAGSRGTMQGATSARFSSGQCREGGGWLVVTGWGRRKGGRPNMSDMNTEELKGQRAGLMWSEGVGAFYTRTSPCFSLRLFSQKARELKP